MKEFDKNQESRLPDNQQVDQRSQKQNDYNPNDYQQEQAADFMDELMKNHLDDFEAYEKLQMDKTRLK